MDSLLFNTGSSPVVICADGRRVSASLERFSRLAGLSTVSGECSEYDLLLTDRRGAGFYFEENGAVVLPHDSSMPCHLSGEWRRMVLLAVLHKMLQTGETFLMHGALLELEPGEGTILFGHSGVGKSTTVLRTRMAGGRCRCDDVILCAFKDGELTAAPLPTPSYYTEYYSEDLCYPFNPVLKVKNLFHLCRGREKEALIDVSRDLWLPPLVHALAFHFMGLFSTLPNAAEYGNIILDIAMRLAEMFPYKTLEAHWSGNILQTLKGDK